MKIYSKNNDELNNYFKILCHGDYPLFIDKYLKLEEFQRLKENGFFCGCDYTKLQHVKYWYSRLDHSIACALMAWNFTKDKKETLAALFHDLGTPSFSHCIDFLMGDSINQESSEKPIIDVINNSPNIIKNLVKDKINIEDICDLSKYPIVENKKPKLCIDRLDGVLQTGLIWQQFWNLEEIEKIYNSIVVLKNEDNKDEIGFNDIVSAISFFDGVYKYSMILQSNEDKFTMQYISDVLNILFKNGELTFEDLYIKTESEIINIISNNIFLNKSWTIFTESSSLIETNELPSSNYYVSINAKKRYVIPLCIYNNDVRRLDEISINTKKLVEKYMTYESYKYAYIKDIKNIWNK